MRDINPLNVLNQREVSIMPPHFTQIKHEVNHMNMGQTHNEVVDHIKNWIFSNLDGRFTVTEYSKKERASKLGELDDMEDWNDYHGFDVEVTIGFEVPEESTFFSLAYQPLAHP
jgi:hypothetical protein